MSLESLLVANRGEIALRVMRTARALGLRTIAVHSDADADAPHVALADSAVRLGPAPAAQSYLNAAALLEAARRSGAQAIHPGYGFLSENADFAQAVIDAGLTWIGPPPSAIRAMGNKAEARRLMLAAAVPCVPGYDGADQDDETLVQEAERIGYPVMVKAAAGGGGRGMRLVRDAADLAAALPLARAEARGAFGSDQLILERAITRAAHVEIQVIADAHGTILHLGERDCSVQRRHQKVIEEAPGPAVTPDLRARMGAAAVEAARAVGYQGAGTVEFLLEESGDFHFLEMNTRLQVEHPVTEMVTGRDLVAMQIAVARGEALDLRQQDVVLHGHAIEARLYAEDAPAGFLPATGPVRLWRPASGEGVRVDAGIRSGMEVSPHYDPMLAKVIAWGETREVARARLMAALRGSIVLGTVTNTRFLHDVLAAPAFASGSVTTDLIARTWPDGVPAPAPEPRAVAIAGACLAEAGLHAARARAGYVSDELLGWSSAVLPAMPMTLIAAEGEAFPLSIRALFDGWEVTVGEERFAVIPDRAAPDPETGLPAIVRIGPDRVPIVALVDGGQLHLALGPDRWIFRAKGSTAVVAGASEGEIRAPMPGVVADLAVEPGQEVARGEVVAVLEAMKMQHQIKAPTGGVIAELGVRAGDQIAAGALIARLESPREGDERS